MDVLGLRLSKRPGFPFSSHSLDGRTSNPKRETPKPRILVPKPLSPEGFRVQGIGLGFRVYMETPDDRDFWM